MRGVDEDGHVANYCETEQMVFYHQKRASFVQVQCAHVKHMHAYYT